MDSTPDPSTWQRVELHHIPDDVIIYILDFLESTTLAAMTLVNRYLQQLATPALYRNITIPKKTVGVGGKRRSAALLLRTLSRSPELAVLVRHLENAPPFISSPLLRSIWFEPTSSSNSPTGYAEQSAYTSEEFNRISIDVMKSCVNLRSLVVLGNAFSLDIVDPCQWLGFLLHSSIKLKKLKALVYMAGGSVRRVWNGFVASVLDVQLSLESLELSFDNRNPVFEKERMDKWAPKLRILSVSPAAGLKALLCKKRSIETVVICSIPARDISHLCAKELKNADTVKEIVYRGPMKDELVNFAELFGAMPTSLRIFRGEMSLRFSTEDFFLQELLAAFALTPCLTEFDIKDSSRSMMGFFHVGEADIFHTDLESYEDAYMGDRATWLAQYSEICPDLQAFTFPDGRRWDRINGQWISRACSGKSTVGQY
ncbi:hypothetical protein FS837_003408 [Tulasnella sp. UAMH 9824]|nr:hypothetical protein FS837_003408 [Tulasnella sp. UAMH 9824]